MPEGYELFTTYANGFEGTSGNRGVTKALPALTEKAARRLMTYCEENNSGEFDGIRSIGQVDFVSDQLTIDTT